jgi:hypothetical protein
LLFCRSTAAARSCGEDKEERSRTSESASRILLCILWTRPFHALTSREPPSPHLSRSSSSSSSSYQTHKPPAGLIGRCMNVQNAWPWETCCPQRKGKSEKRSGLCMYLATLCTVSSRISQSSGIAGNGNRGWWALCIMHKMHEMYSIYRACLDPHLGYSRTC